MTFDPKRIQIDMKCGCGAHLSVDTPHEYSSISLGFVELAKAWIAAHKAHHEEPKGET